MEGRLICFDLDDTLIPNTHLYHRPIWRCGEIISRALGHQSPYPIDLLKLHYDVDSSMVKRFGFSQDRFPTSWVQAYEQVCAKVGTAPDPEVSAELYREAAEFKRGPFAPFPGVVDVLRELRGQGYALHMITAGDEQLQRTKVGASGLGPLFDSVRITGVEKKEVMREIAGERPGSAVMVGDSKKSDIIPAIELGMVAVHVPSNTWAFANADVDPGSYHTIASVRDLPALLDRIWK
jgi:putative hydrolase of the HAD superfamily